MAFYDQTTDVVLSALHATAAGLDAAHVAQRQQEHGFNELKAKQTVSAWKLLFGQFQDFLIWILLVAAVVSFVMGERIDAIAIFAIVVINAVLGFVQEMQAEKSIAALKNMQSPEATVRRGGAKFRIAARELVVGDIIELGEGDKIPADARLLEVHQLQVDESILTGESVPVEKVSTAIAGKQGIGDQKNCVFGSTIVTRGKGLAVVIRIGMQTEVGQIAASVQEDDDKVTPMQKSLDKLGKQLGILCLVLVVPGAVIGIIEGKDPLSMFMTAVSLAVAAIPEGLPIVVTLALAFGTKRMLKVGALIRRLPVVETLGSTDVICTDKTGTLTQNKMSAEQIAVFDAQGKLMPLPTTDWLQQHGAAQQEFLTNVVLCNDATALTGDPTEMALVKLGEIANLEIGRLSQVQPRLDEIPFNSTDKFMGTLHRYGSQYRAYFKGALEVVLLHCTHVSTAANKLLLTSEDRQQITLTASGMAEQGLRVLAFAYYDQQDDKLGTPHDWVFGGLVALQDPPRAEVPAALAECAAAGVRVVMITGDHAVTAAAIGAQIGLPKSKTLVGAEIDALSDEMFLAAIEEHSIYARVSPQNKLRILQAHQSKGRIVAMTGDGVNDAAAIKKADIGIAVGSGTDLAKDVADMILLDDNFATIAKAIREGRNIFNNIKKFLRYLIGANLGEVMVVFLSILLGMPLVLYPIQILFINLVTDSLPALALTVDQDDPSVMNRPPINPQKEILSGLLSFALIIGTLCTVSVLGVFILIWKTGGGLEQARTAAFATMVIYEFFVVFSARSDRSAFDLGIFSNKYLWGAVGLGTALQLLVIYLPFFQTIFRTVALPMQSWVPILISASSGFVILEFFRYLSKRFSVSHNR